MGTWKSYMTWLLSLVRSILSLLIHLKSLRLWLEEHFTRHRWHSVSFLDCNWSFVTMYMHFIHRNWQNDNLCSRILVEVSIWSRHVTSVIVCAGSAGLWLVSCNWILTQSRLAIRLTHNNTCRTGTEDCCHVEATCTCGAHNGYFSCICPPGYYGRGLRGDCHSKKDGALFLKNTYLEK